MTLKTIASNMTEIHTDGKTVLVSYSTPVAACVHGLFYRTEQKWSATTSRHITKWLQGYEATTKPQAFFDALLN